MSEVNLSTIACYLDDSGDAAGVVGYIRDKWPKSLATYLSGVKKAWMTLEHHHDAYPADSEASIIKADELLRTEPRVTKPALAKAVIKLREFHDLPLADKHKAQRAARRIAFTGEARIDAIICDIRLFPDYMKELRLSDGERIALKKRGEDALDKKSSSAWELDAGVLVDKARGVIEDDISAPFDIACALALLTGRRMIELFKTGSFSAGADATSAVFSGQAKTGSAEDHPYRIPLLCPFRSVEVALSRLRRMKPCGDMSNAAVNSKYSGRCNVAARQWLGPGRKFHDFREGYGVVCYNLCLPHKWSLNLFVSRVLGHSGLENSLHYTAIHVNGIREADRMVWKDAMESTGEEPAKKPAAKVAKAKAKKSTKKK
ncbi:hypothetical protein JKP88DRAFT_181538 [Tribonema minus]|uniref:Telomere resolvase ResT/TelK catalytic domain-containing protein n=1 Tax=Tribonema minus TaxID=303371 RepID=A0A835Z621_9STRA|nr:hypothetical protein JKP88DRAFT_181538 [Tribonema minus]